MLGILLCCFNLLPASRAQDYEMRVVEEGLTAIVQIRCMSDPAPGRNDLITDLVFGIKWNAPEITELSIEPGEYQIVASGQKATHEEYFYQGFGAMETPYRIPEDWRKEYWINICQIRIRTEDHVLPAQEPLLHITEPKYRLDTGPNIGVNLVDHTPTIVAQQPQQD